MQKSQTKDIVEALKKLLLADWSDVNFVIGTNPHDFIEIKFDLKSLDPRGDVIGLHSYLNTLMSCNTDLIKFQVRKIIKYWPYKDSEFVYYMIAPPWVKTYVNDPINQ